MLSLGKSHLPTTDYIAANPLKEGSGSSGALSLLILRDIMTRVNHEREDMSLPTVKPCDIFDLIGGTSTGGLALKLLMIYDPF